MYIPRWELLGFDVLVESNQRELILAMVSALVEINRKEIRAAKVNGMPLPPLFQSGVVYAPQGRQDDWKDAMMVLASGCGSCNSLTAWRVAELLENGTPAWPAVQAQVQNLSRGTTMVFHVIDAMLAPSGYVWECASRTLGMQSEPYE
jgi:hypothetical protein